MGTIQENLVQWSAYAWGKDGHEWSGSWGDSNSMWQATILPRIRSVARCHHILEIAPGYGRCTQFLLELCDRMTVVDLTQKCIDTCKNKFSAHANLEYHVNDGKSLDFVDDESVDFVFSWDSLVHANDEVVEAYLNQLGCKLKPGGFGFMHHSNMRSYRDAVTGQINAKSQHWRDTSMSAELFRDFCDRSGLKCVAQEILAWEPGVLSDAFSLFTRESLPSDRETKVVVNHGFGEEVENARRIHELYYQSHG